MITVAEYFGGKGHSDEHQENAENLLASVNGLLVEAEAAGAFTPTIDIDTGTEISGSHGGSGDGGFRLPNAKTGAPNSSHKTAQAVDVYDKDNRLDLWLDTFEDGQGGNTMLASHGLYREAGAATRGWTHLTTRAPKSGRRTFTP